MHNNDHDNKQGNGNGMMWMMVFCCAMPLVFILLFGTGGRALGASTWVIVGGVAVMVITHLLMMGKSRGHSNEKQVMPDSGEKNKDGGCCHK